ncbi:Uncharacterised protein [Candidatus Norongarragalina meridionalis]|nr:Uncharacterised protein [Candidatus Norongarragalina meridionalis]
MKITKGHIIYGFTVFIILAFVLETFVVVMWKPAETAATPTPSPQVQTFEGTGFAKAKILSLGGTLFVFCNSTQDAAPLVKDVPGVSRVFATGNSAYLVTAPNATPYLAAAIDGALAGICDAVVLRSSHLEFKETATLAASSGNGTKMLATKELDYLQSAFPPYVDAGHVEGDNVTMKVYLSINDAGGLSVSIEEQRSAFEYRFEGGGFATAKIAELKNELYVKCNATDAEGRAGNVSGVKNVTRFDEQTLFVDFEGNATAVAQGIASALPDCAPKVLRSAAFDFTDSVTIASENNDTRTVLGSDLAGATGFVAPEHAVNETVLLSVRLQMSGATILGTAIQEVG